MESLLVTSGARRGCGIRQPGGAYLAVPLGPGGSPAEHFLIDPPILIDPDSLGLSAVGTALHTCSTSSAASTTRPSPSSIEEARRLGISRRIAKTADFSRITRARRLILLHAHADIANAWDFETARRCPCDDAEHLAEGFSGMCARLWWDEPLPAAHRLAAFASFPIPQIEVVRDPSGGTHTDTIATASKSGVPVVEVDQ
jgi:hypothetical protein